MIYCNFPYYIIYEYIMIYISVVLPLLAASPSRVGEGENIETPGLWVRVLASQCHDMRNSIPFYIGCPVGSLM
jgi:hypothetical protein